MHGVLRWAAFENDTEGRTTEDTIPWPSNAAQLLEDLNAIALAETSDVDCAVPTVKTGDSGSDRGSRDHGKRRQRACDAAPMVRATIRRAALRWHPDKFAGRYRARVPPDEWPRVLARVQTLTQELTAAWAEASHAAARRTQTASDRKPG